MNQTKKITQGALLLAITAALTYINLRLGNILDTLVILVIPVIIIVYSSMNSLRDGLILCFSMGLLGLILGFAASSPSYIAYFPIAVLVGIGYSYGVQKDFSKGKLLLTSVALFAIGEVLVSYLILPLFGIPVSEMFKEIEDVFFQADYSAYGDYAETMQQSQQLIISTLGDKFGALIAIVFAVTVILTGVIEGAIVHILSVFLLRRFRIKEFEAMSLYNVKANPPLAYASLLAVAGFFFSTRIADQKLYMLVVSLSLVGAIILIYYGYVFVMLYGSVVWHKNLTIVVVAGIFLLAPFMALFFIILGFLYASGPLRQKIEMKRSLS